MFIDAHIFFALRLIELAKADKENIGQPTFISNIQGFMRKSGECQDIHLLGN